MVSSLIHPSNVNSKRGLQQVQHVHIRTVRKRKYIRKNNYAALHLKKKTANKLYLVNTKWENILIAEFGMVSAETACWDRERK